MSTLKHERGDALKALTTPPVYHVLWTGGWDSTFRVLQILSLRPEAVVQPHYLRHFARLTTSMELARVDEIIRAYEELSGSTGRIKRTLVTAVEDVPADVEITRRWQALRASTSLGEQYDWLARYVKYINIGRVELGIQKGGHIDRLIRRHLRRIIYRGENTYVVDEASCGDLSIFSGYYFPIIDKTKTDMKAHACQLGVDHIMERTWFCFFPIAGKHPCGRCNPCLSAFQQGMRSRIGWRGLTFGIPVALLLRHVPHSARSTLKRVLRGA